MKRIVILGFILLLSTIMISACVRSSGSDNHTPDYSRISGTHTINFSFGLEKGYKGIAPLRDLTTEEYEKRSAEELSPLPDYEIYKGDTLAFSFRFTTSAGAVLESGLPTLYEQQREKARAEGNLFDEGTKDLYEYFFYKRANPDQPDQTLYVYVAVFKDLEGPGFSAASSISREEVEKRFKSLEIWFTKRSMEMRNISVDQGKKSIEADWFAEKSSTACHMVVNYEKREIISSTDSDLSDDFIVYEAQAFRELVEYVDNGRTEKELEVTWE